MNKKKVLLCLLVTLVLALQVNTAVFAAAKKKEASYSKEDVKYLACLIYTESGNQSYKGKVAVGNVIMNRASNKNTFGHVNTIKEVIYDNKWSVQFGVTAGGKNSPMAKALKNYSSLKSTKSMKSCIKAAKEALSGDNVVGSRLNFTGYSKKLASKHSNHMKIGSHIFY